MLTRHRLINRNICNMALSANDILDVEKNIIFTLKNIYDPEIPVNIYDLGLIYNLDFSADGTASIEMTLTAPNCPMAEDLVEQVKHDVATVDEVKNVEVNLTFEPAWDRSRISEEALLEMGWL